MHNRDVVVCFSGGVDSTALIDYYLSRHFTIRAVHFNYGQPAFQGEAVAVRSISTHYAIEVVTQSITPILPCNSVGEYFARNALFLLLACCELNLTKGLLALGIHGGTSYYDCSPQFASHIQSLIDGYSGGNIMLDFPFLKNTKAEIVQYCIEQSVPLALTYSCERNPTVPCGACRSCLDRVF